ncbi:uncharacterized protein PgNI_07740 [Pyricularia grisea]|uniref:Uncharacterized protein n=1 Tax=Pyricularia grisea TaxID=148305 RepID=A0A6P8B1Z9_PYRGI|nr:uncharacterized protein PgNI_07740 [Pyricularia grisea]TLD08930.1 hypothetical protein PgNI_07740 [Pyricularia grisea]
MPGSKQRFTLISMKKKDWPYSCGSLAKRCLTVYGWMTLLAPLTHHQSIARLVDTNTDFKSCKSPLTEVQIKPQVTSLPTVVRFSDSILSLWLPRLKGEEKGLTVPSLAWPFCFSRSERHGQVPE